MLGAITVSITFTVLVVAVHYEVLRALNRLCLEKVAGHRSRLMFIILGAIGGHVLEIWIYAAGSRLIDAWGGGAIEGARDTLLDHVYFSAMAYTTVGFGDMVPVGGMRFFTALTAVTGLVCITWTASFTYLQMARYWNDEQ